MKMKKITLWLFLLAALALPAAGQGYLKTRGHDFVDEQGNKVFLRGVALGNWLLPEGYMWRFGKRADRPRTIEKTISDLVGEEKAKAFWKKFRENFITEADIRRMAGLGFNSTRIALDWRYFMGEGSDDSFREDGFALLKRAVGWCEKYHIYVILDLHAAPGGQTGANIDDSANDKPELFTDPRNQEKAIKLWCELARRYKDNTTVIAYDLLNEPLPDKHKELNLNKELFPFYQRVGKAIRAIDAKHMLTLEGANWANDWNSLGKPFDGNVFYQFHKYWNKNDQASIKQFVDRRQEWNVPIWVGETGENNNQWYREAFDLLEKNNIGWMFWTWKKLGSNNNPYGVKPPAGWEKIVAYTRRGENKPTPEEAEKILNEFLENIKFENCVCNEEAVKAILRK